MDLRRLHALRASGRHPQRPLIHPGRREPHVCAGRCHHHLGAGSRSPLTRPTMPRLGVAKDAWVVNVFGENLGNSNASTFISTDQFIVAQTPLAAAGPRRHGRLQILSAAGNEAARGISVGALAGADASCLPHRRLPRRRRLPGIGARCGIYRAAYRAITPSMADKTVVLTGRELTVDQVVQVARYGAKVSLSPRRGSAPRTPTACCWRRPPRACRFIGSIAVRARGGRNTSSRGSARTGQQETHRGAAARDLQAGRSRRARAGGRRGGDRARDDGGSRHTMSFEAASRSSRSGCSIC